MEEAKLKKGASWSKLTAGVRRRGSLRFGVGQLIPICAPGAGQRPTALEADPTRCARLLSQCPIRFAPFPATRKHADGDPACAIACRAAFACPVGIPVAQFVSRNQCAVPRGHCLRSNFPHSPQGCFRPQAGGRQNAVQVLLSYNDIEGAYAGLRC